MEGEFVYQTVKVEDSLRNTASAGQTFEGYGIVGAVEYSLNCPQVGVRFEGGLSTGNGGVIGESVLHFDPDFAPSVVALPVVDRWLTAHYTDALVARDGALPIGGSMLPSDGSLRSMAYSRLASSWRFRRLESTLASTWLWRTGDLVSDVQGLETLSIGGKAFVGTELAGESMFDVEKNGSLRIGVRWATFFPNGLPRLAGPIAQSSFRTDWAW